MTKLLNRTVCEMGLKVFEHKIGNRLRVPSAVWHKVNRAKQGSLIQALQTRLHPSPPANPSRASSVQTAKDLWYSARDTPTCMFAQNSPMWPICNLAMILAVSNTAILSKCCVKTHDETKNPMPVQNAEPVLQAGSRSQCCVQKKPSYRFNSIKSTSLAPAGVLPCCLPCVLAGAPSKLCVAHWPLTSFNLPTSWRT